MKKQRYDFLLLQQTLLVQKDDLLLSGLKSKIASSVLPAALDTLRKAMMDKGDEIEFSVPNWCKDYDPNDFRMWVFEQNANLQSNKIDTVARNLASML